MTQSVTPAQLAAILVPPDLPYPLHPMVGRVIAQMLVSDTRRRFGLSRAPDGSTWVPLKYRRKRGGSKPLLDTGLLRNSITGYGTPYGAVVGSNLHYAAIHQFGGPIVRYARRTSQSNRRSRTARRRQSMLRRVVGHIPARPFLGISAEAASQIERFLTEYMSGRWGESLRV